MFEYNGKQIETTCLKATIDYNNNGEEGMIEILAEDEAIELTEAHFGSRPFVRSF